MCVEETVASGVMASIDAEVEAAPECERVSGVEAVALARVGASRKSRGLCERL
jgi:hypothetical protein